MKYVGIPSSYRDTPLSTTKTTYSPLKSSIKKRHSSRVEKSPKKKGKKCRILARGSGDSSAKKATHKGSCQKVANGEAS